MEIEGVLFEGCLFVARVRALLIVGRAAEEGCRFEVGVVLWGRKKIGLSFSKIDAVARLLKQVS